MEIRIQPCDHRPPNDICGEHGVCAKASKGRFRYDDDDTVETGYKVTAYNIKSVIKLLF